jgi:fructoselysine 6-kinase
MLPAVVGDNIVDVLVDRQLSSIGGNCLNVAVHLNRLGRPTRYVGSVGDDAAGHWVLDSLAREGLDTSLITVVPGAPTGYAVIRHRDGEREFGDFDRGASQLRLSAAQREALAGAPLIHTSYSSGLEEELAALSLLAPVSFDFDTHLDDDYTRSLLPFVTHAFFSGADAAGRDLHRFAASVLEQGTHSVTITQGAAGSSHWRPGAHWSRSATPVEAVDTLGAGDAYIARMLLGILRDEPPEHAMAGAADLAAEVCATLGALGINSHDAVRTSSVDHEKEIAL